MNRMSNCTQSRTHRRFRLAALAAALALLSGQALAQHVLIRNATVHTAGAQGTLKNTDVLVRDGTIAAIGTRIEAADADLLRRRQCDRPG
jgi:hypothetical protein